MSRFNNPFAQQQSSELSSAAHRFPDVLATDPDLQRGPYPPPPPQQQQQYQQQQQQQQFIGYPNQPQQYPPSFQTQGGPPYLQSQATGFSPCSPGGGGGGGAPSPYPSLQSGGPGAQGAYSGGYGQGYQASPQQPYAADLDPYAHLGALGPASSPAPSSSVSSGGGTPGSGSLLAVPQTQSHPRQYVGEQRGALMAWDEYAWKQLLGRLDALREAWETRLAGLRAAANSGADPTNVQQLLRHANEQVDGIHAAKMQLAEVQSGWRHSTDAASKARVREALNAGITSLPEYPAPVPPHELGGSFIHQAAKQDIMAQYGGGGGGGGGYGAPSQQQQQPQMTGMYGGNTGGYGGGYGGGGMMMMPPQPTGYGGAGGQGGGGYGGYGGGYSGGGGGTGAYY